MANFQGIGHPLQPFGAQAAGIDERDGAVWGKRCDDYAGEARTGAEVNPFTLR
mgnify:CR=1 FL=1